MPINRVIDRSKNLVSLTCKGRVSAGDIRAAYLEMLDDPAFQKGADILWDYREADVDVPTEEDIFSYVDMVKGSREKRGTGYRVAMVADKDLYYGLIRMFQAYSGTLPFELKAFRSLEEAGDWLEKPGGRPAAPAGFFSQP